MTEDLRPRVAALDTDLFSYVESQTLMPDRRALLALHAATAEVRGRFTYLEIGSYLGGSLQAVIRDQRCQRVISIDARSALTVDARGEADYGDNTTERMLAMLSAVPGADLGKLVTFDVGTDRLSPSELPAPPDLCFIDAEHTHDAVLRDARFCAQALNGRGVIAFHDYAILGPAISTFLREQWSEISCAIAFIPPPNPDNGGGIFAIELGDAGVLRHPAIDAALGPRWRRRIWKTVNSWPHSPLPLLLAWTLIPAVDAFSMHAGHGLREYVRSGRR